MIVQKFSRLMCLTLSLGFYNQQASAITFSNQQVSAITQEQVEKITTLASWAVGIIAGGTAFYQLQLETKSNNLAISAVIGNMAFWGTKLASCALVKYFAPIETTYDYQFTIQKNKTDAFKSISPSETIVDMIKKYHSNPNAGKDPKIAALFPHKLLNKLEKQFPDAYAGRVWIVQKSKQLGRDLGNLLATGITRPFAKCRN